MVVILAAAGVGAGAAGIGCAACHRNQWDGEGVHAEFGCNACHARGPADGVALGLHATGAAIPITDASTPEPPGREECLSCHPDVLNATLSSGGIAIDHASCAAASGVCSACHGAALHPGERSAGRVAQMDTCLACHVDIVRPEGCDLCHVGDHRSSDENTPWKVTHGPRWETTNGAGDLSTCRYCHIEPDDCSECHVDMPHPEQWTGNHGTGVGQDRGQCTTCHQSAFCDSCHGTPMPHPADWLPTHSANTDGYDDPLCFRCHMEEDCTLCHVAHTHPGKATPDD